MMDVEVDPDMALSVPLKPLYEEYYCPICFSVIRDCYMTLCGHLFCNDCIKECLNRKHTCPCCNHPTTADQLIRNLHADRIINILEREKETQSKLYFESLINKTNNNSSTNNNNNNGTNNNVSNDNNKLSPIEGLFHKHMKRSLASYEEYYQKLRDKFEKSQEATKQEHAQKMVNARDQARAKSNTLRKSDSEDNKNPRLQKKIAKISKQCDQQLNQLKESFDQSVQLLLDSYDKYMSSFAPARSFLPITISIYIPSKDLRFKNITLKNTDSIQDVKELIKQLLAKHGDPLVEYTKNNIFVLKRPYAENSETVLNNSQVPILQYDPDPGSELVLVGNLLLKSDEPKLCFKCAFEKGTDQVMDYFTCKDCKFNWICKPCAETCHKGHNIVEYILGHKPTWACCYCVKNGKCKIFDSKKKR